MNEIELITEKLFEDIKHIDEDGNAYWEARELQKVLEYVEWRKFKGVINKAMIDCEKSGKEIVNHFVGVDKMVLIGSGTFRNQADFKLSRYACYLIMMEADSRKKIVALGKTYFTIQTRRSELRDMSFDNLSEDEKRLLLRDDTRKHNKTLNKEAIRKGVRDLAKFTNSGYKGLYNGETADDIAKRKNLRYREEILDYMGSEELGANVFRITQTEALLKRQKEVDSKKANDTHFKVGSAIREVIKEFGNTMPEDLTVPDKSIKELEKEEQKINID